MNLSPLRHDTSAILTKGTKMASTTGMVGTPIAYLEAANGVTYAYRRFGTGTGIPLVFLQHFRGNIDNWDPKLVDQIAEQRDVILFDNTGVGSTSGTTPNTVEQMADDAIAFILALGPAEVDLFGFSLGGFVAQDIALSQPELVRRVILAGTGPKGAPGMERWSKDVEDAVVVDETGPAGVLYVFYAHTDTSQAAGQESLGRIYGWADGRDEQPSLEAKNAQYEAVLRWGIRDWDAVARLAEMQQPALILQGDDDIMIPTRASYTLAGLLPNATLHIYPDASHGSIFQHADEAARHTLAFLGE
ncbi:alpha/beta fold hydrolase [Microbacterium sp. P01]|uniref:alpha/beta fold hydrolase n=1 Tax=Microbacterium sp. P01 TaxID=3366261 RepID=UPI00366C8B37